MNLSDHDRATEDLDYVERQLTRINCDAITFNPTEARIAIKVSDVSTVYPMPYGDMHALGMMLQEIPTGATVEQVNQLTAMYSRGWNGGINHFIVSNDIPMVHGRPQLAPVAEMGTSGDAPAPAKPHRCR